MRYKAGEVFSHQITHIADFLIVTKLVKFSHIRNNPVINKDPELVRFSRTRNDVDFNRDQLVGLPQGE